MSISLELLGVLTVPFVKWIRLISLYWQSRIYPVRDTHAQAINKFLAQQPPALVVPCSPPDQWRALVLGLNPSQGVFSLC